MYTTCAFCNAKLDGDGGPSGLGVGRRIAFDEWRGRLWVICPKCARWNLTPLDDRLERIETVARAAHDAKLLAATEQVALLRWQHYDFVRVGKPPRMELAPWRYGERLRARRQERLKYVIPLTVVAVGLGVAAVGYLVGDLVANVTIVGNRRVSLVEPPICAHCGTLLDLRAKHVQHARVVPEARADVAVVVSCPRCHHEAALLTGNDAQVVLRQGLSYLNTTRAGRRRAEEAAQVVDQAGGPDRLIRDVAKRELTLRSLRPERRLALEMAVDEQAEVQELEQEWRDAEELADIADGTLSADAQIEEELRRLKQGGADQPNG